MYKKIKAYYRMPFLLRDFLNFVTNNKYEENIKLLEKKYEPKKSIEDSLKILE